MHPHAAHVVLIIATHSSSTAQYNTAAFTNAHHDTHTKPHTNFTRKRQTQAASWPAHTSNATAPQPHHTPRQQELHSTHRIHPEHPQTPAPNTHIQRPCTPVRTTTPKSHHIINSEWREAHLPCLPPLSIHNRIITLPCERYKEETRDETTTPHDPARPWHQDRTFPRASTTPLVDVYKRCVYISFRSL